MEATSKQLRELADLLNKFPGMTAREWTPGDTWTLRFTASDNTEEELRASVVLLGTFATVRGLSVEIVPGRTIEQPQMSYRIGGNGDTFQSLFPKLADAQKNLWRRR